MIPPKRFDIFPSDWGMLGRSRCVQHNMFNVYSTAGTVAKKKQASDWVDAEENVLISEGLS